MKILLDTNILIHREASRVVNKDIGMLFRWLDKLHFEKCVHTVSINEFNRLTNVDTRNSIGVKLEAYRILKIQSPLNEFVSTICNPLDLNDNDRNDTLLLNEIYCNRIDLLISEDKKLHNKASLLGLNDLVFTIESFIEKVTAENPSFQDYKILSVKKELFGNINHQDEFFDSFRDNYPGYDKWFSRKSEEEAYVCISDSGITAFLYLKREDNTEPYTDLEPQFQPKKRLKIGAFKVALNGFRLGERFLKIIFDNAICHRVDEIYCTIFDNRPEQIRLIGLLEDFGFVKYGVKRNVYGDELVFVRNMERQFNFANPKLTFPYFSNKSRVFITPIYPEYHTNLFPDSILNTESPIDFIEHEPFRNAIGKVYVSRSIERNLESGDIIIFYRTKGANQNGYYHSVISTIGIVLNTVQNILTPEQFVRECRKRSVFTDDELLRHWNYKPSFRPFICNFLYAYSFPKRLNLKQLIDMGVVNSVASAPRGFTRIENRLFERIIKETNTDEHLIVD